MLIGELSRAAGVDAQTIRFYEREGLLAAPRRLENGYRRYDADAIARLAFIRSAQAADLTLAEIAGVLRVRDRGDSPCSHVQTLLLAKLDAVQARRRELDALESELQRLIAVAREVDEASCVDADVCSIIAPTG